MSKVVSHPEPAGRTDRAAGAASAPGSRRPRFAALAGMFPVGDARSLYRWALIGISVGVIAGIVAIAFYEALSFAGQGFLGVLLGIDLPENGVAPGAGFSWSTDPMRFLLLPLVMLAGGLATGLVIATAAPEVEGHGTDQSIRAFHRGRGVVRLRVPPLKFLASLFTIGTGGSGGREGPTAQIGSGIGSFLTKPLGLSTRERRVAMMAGVGAGIGAIFKAPFGAALLSSEILYLSDFEPEVIMPSIIASVISYSFFGAFVGFGPEFVTPGVGWSPDHLAALPLFAVLGAVAGLLGVFYVVSFDWTRQRFARAGVPLWARPAIGVGILGAAAAVLYYLVPAENHLLAVGGLGIGYGIVQWFLFQNQIGVALLLIAAALIVVKIVGTSLTVGSGGSAGLFGPAIVSGALIGFVVVGSVNRFLPMASYSGDVPAFVIIGMMAFFGSVSRAPIATILMVVEMTGSEALLVPAMVAIFVAYYVVGRRHIYSEQVENRLASPAHTTEYFAEFLRHIPVTQAIAHDVATATPATSVRDAEFRLSRSPYPILAIVVGERLVGEVRLADILEVPVAERGESLVHSILQEGFPTVRGSSSLLDAIGLMDRDGVDAVLVVDEPDGHALTGVVTREAIARFQRSPLAG